MRILVDLGFGNDFMNHCFFRCLEPYQSKLCKTGRMEPVEEHEDEDEEEEEEEEEEQAPHKMGNVFNHSVHPKTRT